MGYIVIQYNLRDFKEIKLPYWVGILFLIGLYQEAYSYSTQRLRLFNQEQKNN